MAQFPSSIDIAKLGGSKGFTIRLSGDDRDRLSLGSAGDVNGDGFEDVIVGAPESGAAYVVFGRGGGFPKTLDVADLNGKNGFRISESLAGASAGVSVSTVGDINRDGFGDVMVSAPNDMVGDSSAGSVYVVYGRAKGFDADLNFTDINGQNGFRIVPGPGEDGLGTSISDAGDVNGDGRADIIVSVSTSGADWGPAYVVFGTKGGQGRELGLGDLNGKNGFRIENSSGAAFVPEVSSAGDVNGDGFDDVIIGTPSFGEGGKAYVVFGRKGGFDADFDLVADIGAGGRGFVFNGDDDDGMAGQSVSGIGDVNGDGRADVVIGAPGAGEAGQGAAYVVFGRKTFDVEVLSGSLDGKNGFRILGEEAGDEAGMSVSSAGDVNGDGFDDILVSAPEAVAEVSGGFAYVVFGKAKGFASTIGLDSLNGRNGFKLESSSAYESTALAVSSAGDVNGDGFDDILVSGEDPYAASAFTYVVFGRMPDTAVKRTGTEADQTLAGGNKSDVLKGLGGDDRLFGHGGKDRLEGGTGDDRLGGGLGDDVLKGGAGKDTFRFDVKLKDNVDRILDYKAADDRFRLDSEIFDALKAGPLKGSQFKNIANGEVDKDDRILYDRDSGKLFYDEDGKGGDKAVHFATLVNKAALSAEEFSVF